MFFFGEWKGACAPYIIRVIYSTYFFLLVLVQGGAGARRGLGGGLSEGELQRGAGRLQRPCGHAREGEGRDADHAERGQRGGLFLFAARGPEGKQETPSVWPLIGNASVSRVRKAMPERSQGVGDGAVGDGKKMHRVDGVWEKNFPKSLVGVGVTSLWESSHVEPAQKDE